MGSDNFNFEILARQHMDALYTRAIQLEPDMQRVEDLIQLTYQRAFDLFQAVRRDPDFKQWLFDILDEIFTRRNGQFSPA